MLISAVAIIIGLAIWVKNTEPSNEVKIGYGVYAAGLSMFLHLVTAFIAGVQHNIAKKQARRSAENALLDWGTENSRNVYEY